MKRFIFAFLTLALLLTGCEGMPGVVTVTPKLPDPSVSVEETPFVAIAPTELLATPSETPMLVEMPTATLPATETATTAATETLPPTPTDPPSSIIPADYLMDVAMDYDAKKMVVQQKIRYINGTGKSLDNLVLAVVPNLWPETFSLQTLTLYTDTVPEYKLDGQRLTITLPASLAPAGEIMVNLVYSLLPPAHSENPDPDKVRPEIFGYTRNQLNLVDWYPYIVPYQGGDWVLRDPWFYGEHLSYDPANFDISVHFADQKKKPGIASSGEQEAISDGMRLTGQNMRTFALALSKDFKVSSTNISGVEVQSYYFPVYEDAGKAALKATITALRTYNEIFGPYPHKSLTVVQGDFNDGMEFDGLFFLSNAFYNLYDKTERNYLVLVAAHETCHQWWFGVVANDQAEEPWLDESLSTYCERLFYEKNYPDAVQWWWGYRIDFYHPEGKIDNNVASYGGFTPYTNAVYRRGAHFIEDLRVLIGDEAFFAFIKDYYTQMSGKRATRVDFFRILASHTTADLSGLIKEYFAKP